MRCCPLSAEIMTLRIGVLPSIAGYIRRNEENEGMKTPNSQLRGVLHNSIPGMLP
jgi:hypothetical protein